MNKRELLAEIKRTKNMLKWDNSIDALYDYDDAVKAYNATVPIRKQIIA